MPTAFRFTHSRRPTMLLSQTTVLTRVSPMSRPGWQPCRLRLNPTKTQVMWVGSSPARSIVVDSQLLLSLCSVAEAAPAAAGYPLAVLRYLADARERRGDRPVL